ncbi:MAG: zf-TFIIB domain-containing protein [Aquabacterium sp.]|nr:zf-TFIIB domain-containing protein [Aquabacterium sp.]
MKCPHCHDVTLVMSDRQGVEIDYCPQCRGVWLDRGELDKLIERSVTVAAAPAPVPQAAYAPQPQAYAPQPSQPQSAQRPPHHRDFDDSDFGKHGRQGYRKPKSWLSEIFD